MAGGFSHGNGLRLCRGTFQLVPGRQTQRLRELRGQVLLIPSKRAVAQDLNRDYLFLPTTPMRISYVQEKKNFVKNLVTLS
jgi:hypothetical protein